MLAMVPTSRPEFEGGLRRLFGDGSPQDRAWAGQVLTPLLDDPAAGGKRQDLTPLLLTPLL